MYNRVGDKALTADLVSQVFLKAMLNIKSFKYKGFPFSSWLYRIAINEVNMHFRKAKKQMEVSLDETLLQPMADTLELSHEDHDMEAMVNGLNELEAVDVELIEMRFFESRSFKEMGVILGISEGNAKIRLYRSVKKLRKVIENQRRGGHA